MTKSKREKKNKKQAARESMHKPKELYIVQGKPRSRPAGMTEESPNTWTTGSMETNIDELLSHLCITPPTPQTLEIVEQRRTQ